MTSVGVMWPRSSRTGTVSLKVPEPLSRWTSQTALSSARYSQNSLMPPSKRNVSSVLPAPSMPRSSRTMIVRPGTRKAV
ncbi:hypothetical protein SCALM49S_04595 [Streptomyces californicus]